jgi:hypothetical protein
MSSEKMFPLPPKKPSEGQITPEQEEVLDKVAKKVVQKRMTVPAIVFIESVKPLNFIGAQVMVFFEPIVQSLFEFKSYNIFREAIENRDNVELLMQKIEKYDAESVKIEKAYKIKKKEYLKGKSFWFKLKTMIVGYRVPIEELEQLAREMEEKQKLEREQRAQRQKQIGKTGFDDSEKKEKR